MSVLHDTVASHDTTDKLKVELTNISKPRRRSSLSVIYAPFRSFAGKFLWELETIPKSQKYVFPKWPPMMIRAFDASEQQQLVDMKSPCVDHRGVQLKLHRLASSTTCGKAWVDARAEPVFAFNLWQSSQR